MSNIHIKQNKRYSISRKRKGQFYILSAVFVIISLYTISYSLFYDNAHSSNDYPLLELYKIREIFKNVDYIINTSKNLNESLLLLHNDLEEIKEKYNLQLVELGYTYYATLKEYHITLKIKGKYNTIIKKYRIKK